MIVREQGRENFILVKQHDHAEISGQLAEHWNEELIVELEKQNDAIYGVYQHDLGWVDLDSTPFWNDQKKVPYSFVDFPLAPKLIHYKHGIDQVEKINQYAALLCSLHYCSLGGVQSDTGEWFLQNEKERQQKLKEQLEIDSPVKEDLLENHFHMLQFCDRLAVYLCINEPGVQKGVEFKKYKDGFKNSEYFTNGKKIIANWLDENQVSVHPFPFKKEFNIRIKYKEVNKKEIGVHGIIEAYKNAVFKEHTIKIKGSV